MNFQKDNGTIYQTIKIKNILDECFQDYNEISMLISVSYCDWKCLKERNLPVEICQNCSLVNSPTIEYDIDDLIKRYLNNPITKAIIFGGLEPIFDINNILCFIDKLRNKYNNDDDIVIYTGYYPDEIENEIKELQKYKNIIIKFGRFIPNIKERYDDILGITLSSENQFSYKIS